MLSLYVQRIEAMGWPALLLVAVASSVPVLNVVAVGTLIFWLIRYPTVPQSLVFVLVSSIVLCGAVATVTDTWSPLLTLIFAGAGITAMWLHASVPTVLWTMATSALLSLSVLEGSDLLLLPVPISPAVHGWDLLHTYTRILTDRFGGDPVALIETAVAQVAATLPLLYVAGSLMLGLLSFMLGRWLLALSNHVVSMDVEYHGWRMRLADLLWWVLTVAVATWVFGDMAALLYALGLLPLLWPGSRVLGRTLAHKWLWRALVASMLCMVFIIATVGGLVWPFVVLVLLALLLQTLTRGVARHYQHLLWRYYRDDRRK